MEVILIVLGWGVVAAAVYLIASRLFRRSISTARVEEDIERDQAIDATAATDRDANPLRRWLGLAGYRTSNAMMMFLLALTGCLVLAAIVAFYFMNSGFIDEFTAYSENVPGGFGNIFKPVIVLAPLISFLIFVSAPFLIVRARRRKRIADMEKDLPTILELLAVLGESGLGFDGALARILDAQVRTRPMGMELRLFQVETLAGVPRIRAFRRLQERTQVPSVSIFVSAMVQAEQIGSGLTGVLRRQADDLRNRRREQAMMLAEALPVKLVFPLVACFLPGIFIATLGPAFAAFFNLADSLTRDVAQP